MLGSPSPRIPDEMKWYDQIAKEAGNVLRISPLGVMTG